MDETWNVVSSRKYLQKKPSNPSHMLFPKLAASSHSSSKARSHYLPQTATSVVYKEKKANAILFDLVLPGLKKNLLLLGKNEAATSSAELEMKKGKKKKKKLSIL